MNLSKAQMLIMATVGTSATLVSSILADTISVGPGGDIQLAIDGAASGDVIELAAGTYVPNAAISTDGKAITIRGAFDAAGDPASVIDAQDQHRVFLIENDFGQIVMENLQVRNGSPNEAELDTNGRGGGICIAGTTGLSIRNCWFVGNEDAVFGGVVRPDFEFIDCLFSQNNGAFASAIGYVAGIGETTMRLEGCRFESNTSLQHTVIAGFMPEGHQLTVSNCDFSGNTATSILLAAGTEAGKGVETPDVEIENVTCTDNTVSRTIGWGSGNLSIRDSTFDGQGSGTCVGLGIAPQASPGDLLIEDSVFRGYESGGIRITDVIGSVDIRRSAFRSNRGPAFVIVRETNDPAGAFFTDCVFTDNLSPVDEGAVRLRGPGTFLRCGWAGNAANGGAAVGGSRVVMDDCFVNENSSGDAGSVIQVESLEATDCEFTNNASSGDGGLVNIDALSGQSVIRDCFFFRNFTREVGVGGGLCLSGGASVEILDCRFERNEAFFGGAIMNESSGDMLVRGCEIIDNGALAAGGGIYLDNGTQSSIQGTFFCRNDPSPISGNYSDLGGNIFSNDPSCEVIPGDFDGNLVVDGGDLAVVLGSWGVCGTDCVADLDGNRIVDGGDLAIVLGNWGSVDR